MLRTRVEYNLSFATKGKSLLANKGTKSLNLLHPLLILVITLSNALPLLQLCHQDNKTFSQFKESGHLILRLDHPVMSVC